jgi:hypothetical protein
MTPKLFFFEPNSEYLSKLEIQRQENSSINEPTATRVLRPTGKIKATVMERRNSRGAAESGFLDRPMAIFTHSKLEQVVNQYFKVELLKS